MQNYNVSYEFKLTYVLVRDIFVPKDCQASPLHVLAPRCVPAVLDCGSDEPGPLPTHRPLRKICIRASTVRINSPQGFKSSGARAHLWWRSLFRVLVLLSTTKQCGEASR